ncbi:MAG: sigma-70 family RNA polymerase sigma factor, partial [Bacteroidota bacterium]
MAAEQLDFRRDLIEGCKRGERQAQRQLYEDYCDAMYNVALRIVGDTHKAEDVIQTSFLDVFRAIDSYNYSATPGAWIKRIVINNSISTVRRKGVAMVYLDETPDRAEELPMNEEGLSMTSIKSAIAKLPDGYRTILTLYLID